VIVFVTRLTKCEGDNRALRDGHFDFGRDRDGMDIKTVVLGRDRL
jgi:hypothetical protein